jgi:hypothetical protein
MSGQGAGRSSPAAGCPFGQATNGTTAQFTIWLFAQMSNGANDHLAIFFNAGQVQNSTNGLLQCPVIQAS